ncbi:MAG: endonuclease domain-containing protein [Microbacteriaceae bacterium]|nr:endonuclease domain-containing protein [Microbacteriaceae bacterium]
MLEDLDDDGRFALLCDAYQVKLPHGWFFSGPTAARIMGVPLPPALNRLEVHVTAAGDFLPRGPFVIGHKARHPATTRMFGRPVRVPAELWCELASVLELDDLIAAGDRMLSEKPIMLTTRRHLSDAVDAHGAGRGVRRLREALPQLREDVWSPRETWTRLVIVRAGLPEPERNRRIYGRDGRLIAIGDLVYPDRKIVIEYEGERWHSDRWSGVDVDRYNRLVLAGWTVIRIRKHHGAEDVERMVREALALHS